MTEESPYDVLTAYQKSAAVMAAAKCGLFQALENGPMSAGELAVPLHLDLYATGVLLDALATCGYIGKRAEGNYEHNDFSRAFTIEGENSLFQIVHKEAFFYSLWANLGSSVRSGKARLAPFADRCASSPKEIRMFLAALNDIAAMSAPAVLDAAGMPESGTLLDFGGGMGGYAVKIAARHPGLSVTIVDAPVVIDLCQGHLENLNMLGMIRLMEGDLFDLDSVFGEERFDTVFVSHVIHDYPPKQAAALIASAARFVSEGGRLYVLDVPKVGQDGSAAEALFDVMMLVEAPGGRTHEDASIRKWVEATGLRVVKMTKLRFGALYEAR